MLRKMRHLSPHVAILICNMYIVFYLIDRVNQAMNFIDNGLTKGLLLILCIAALFNARALLRPRMSQRRGQAASNGPSWPSPRAQRPSERRPESYPVRKTAYRASSAPRDSTSIRRSAPSSADNRFQKEPFRSDSSRYASYDRGQAKGYRRDYDRRYDSGNRRDYERYDYLNDDREQ